MGLLDTVPVVPLPLCVDVKKGVPEGTQVIEGNPVCDGALLVIGLLDTVPIVPLPPGADVTEEGAGVIEGDSVLEGLLL